MVKKLKNPPTPDGFDVVSGGRTVAGVCWGTFGGVAAFLSEEGWYELSDMLYIRAEDAPSGGKVGYVFVHPSEESAFRGALLAAEKELRRLGVREVYGHVGVQDVSEMEASARTDLWLRNGYDVVGEDRQHEPITYRRLPE